MSVEALHATLIAPGERVSPDGSLRGVSPTELALSPESEELLQDFAALRVEFVRTMGWLPNATKDTDRYDTDPGTVALLRTDEASPQRLFTGMRLTRVSTVEGSLTWHMMDGVPSMQDAARQHDYFPDLNKACEEGRAWDLTRLVTALDGRIPLDKLRDSILDLFGAGIAVTVKDSIAPVWFYIATSQLQNFLDRCDIPTWELAAQKVSERDEDVSHFRAVSPQYVLGHLETTSKLSGRRTLSRLTRAIDSLSC